MRFTISTACLWAAADPPMASTFPVPSAVPDPGRIILYSLLSQETSCKINASALSYDIAMASKATTAQIFLSRINRIRDPRIDQENTWRG